MPDWTYTNKGGGGTNSRIQLQFTNSVTKARVDFRYEFGKTKSASGEVAEVRLKGRSE